MRKIKSQGVGLLPATFWRTIVPTAYTTPMASPVITNHIF
jgi:hypothetical protein